MAMFTSVAFAAETDAYELYQKCAKELKYVSSIELSIAYKYYTMTDSKDYVEDNRQTGTVKILINPDKKVQMEVIAFDSETNETAYGYLKDGYAYTKEGGTKEKEAMDTKGMDMQKALSDIGGLRFDLTRDDFKDAKVEKVNGGTKLTFKRARNRSESIYIESAKQYAKGTDIINTVITVGDDGMLKSYSESETYIYTLSSGVTRKVKTTYNNTVKSVNSIEKIDFPKDLDTY